MTQDEIIRMAQEAGFEEGWVEVCNVQEELTNLYNLAFAAGAAHEREACAKVCERVKIQMNYSEAPYNQCANAIRARGEK